MLVTHGSSLMTRPRVTHDVMIIAHRSPICLTCGSPMDHPSGYCSMDNPSITRGSLMDHPSVYCSMDNPSAIRGSPVLGRPWATRVLPMGHPWAHHLWVTLRSLMGHPWVTIGSLVCHPWVTRRSPMGYTSVYYLGRP